MSDYQSRFWWLLPAPSNGKLTPADTQDQPDTAPVSTPSRFWPWASTATAEPAIKAQNAEPAQSLPKGNTVVETSSLWALMFGLTSGTQAESKYSQTVNVTLKTEEYTSWWSVWPLVLRQQDDLESDVEDSATADLFKSAKIAVETSRESCHYAIHSMYGTHEVELAVSGNKTETQPVKFNYKKRPLISNEVVENAMVTQRQRKADLPPFADSNNEIQKQSLKIDEQFKQPNNLELPKQPAQSQQVKADATRSEVLLSNASYRSNEPIKSSSGAVVLPKIQSIFRTITLTTKLRLVGEAFIHGSNTSEKHLYKSTAKHIKAKKRTRTKKVTVIAVHSFLPSKFVKSLIGQSTGNAVSLADEALAAVARWMSQSEDCNIDIDTIALEGQGTINSRVSKSLKLLKNWKQEISKSDFVFVVANSIATPVAIKLVSQMLVSPHFDHTRGKKIGLLSIAGATCGPYTNTDTKVVIRAYTQAENDIIGEIFELQKAKSALSIDVNECLSHLCSCNVKVTMMGSLNDQFIPLYSATSNQIRHPNIYKCMYVDGSSDIPPFMMHLMSMALTMINMGYKDQNLVRDLSDRLQGPISSLGSHGTIFNEAEVYDVGVRFALETTSLVYHVPAWSDRIKPTTAEADKNLYNLPWNVRGLVNDLVQVKHIENLKMLKEIVEEYTKWEPTTRIWKEIRYCFAALEDITIDELLL